MHTEALFLIDDEKPEIFELHTLLEQAMRAHYAVNFAACDSGKHFLGLGVSEESRQHLDTNGITRKTFTERRTMLCCEQCSRDKYCDLFAILNCFERRTHRNFGLAEADVAADQPIHGHAGFHVGFDEFDCASLVGGFDEGECCLHLVLPRRVDGEGMAWGMHAALVQHHKFLGDLSYG